MLVDVRDVAEAEILLAESSDVRSGSRYLLSSGDKIPPESIGTHIMRLFPEFDAAETVAPPKGSTSLGHVHPVWLKVHLRNDLVVRQVGIRFRSFDDTLRSTVSSLMAVGGVKPRMKQ